MKRVTALMLALVLALTACGSDGESAVDDTAETTTADDDGGHAGGDHGESSEAAEDARRIEVEATSFSFDPAEIRATAGEDIAVVLTATDVLHDFTIDELEAHVVADRGETEEGGFNAGEPGRYTYYCTVAGHREAGMEGTLIVE